MPGPVKRKHFLIDGQDFYVEVGEANTKVTVKRPFSGKRDVYRGRRGGVWVRYPQGLDPVPVEDRSLADALDELELRTTGV